MILITGATGNVGQATLAALTGTDDPLPGSIRAGVRDVSRAAAALPAGVEAAAFDFAAPATWPAALDGAGAVFFLRPPQLADVGKIFLPFIAAMRAAGVRHVVFLSVQGAEENALIPHRRIEKALQTSGLSWTFLRPAYFMQNLTTTLRADLLARRVVLPADRALFRWVDVLDVGAVAAAVLRAPAAHAGRAYDVTGDELRSFPQVLAEVQALTGVAIDYESPNPLAFLWRERRQGRPLSYALVLLLLHFLPRFMAAPPAADTVRRLTGAAPRTLAAFIGREVKPLLRAV